MFAPLSGSFDYAMNSLLYNPGQKFCRMSGQKWL